MPVSVDNLVKIAQVFHFFLNKSEKLEDGLVYIDFEGGLDVLLGLEVLGGLFESVVDDFGCIVGVVLVVLFDDFHHGLDDIIVLASGDWFFHEDVEEHGSEFLLFAETHLDLDVLERVEGHDLEFLEEGLILLSPIISGGAFDEIVLSLLNLD